MGGSVIWFLSNEWWCDITNERGTSEWEISHHHEFDKIISQCHPCDYLFIIYHNTRTNRNFVHTYHSHLYHTSTHCHFLTLQIAVCLSCQTQQAMHNVLCDVWQKKILKKNMENKFQKKFKKKIQNKKIQKKNSKQKIQNKNSKKKFKNTKKKVNIFFPHKICIVSHSSYHTRRITLVVSHPTLLPVEYDEYRCDKHNTGIW